MSRLLNWYVVGLLNSMGWPKTKGLLRKAYAPAEIVDRTLEQGLQICAGLGAGRPELGARIIADAFSDNPWTFASSLQLLGQLSIASQGAVEAHPELPPWKAIYAESTLRAFMTEIDWQRLGQETIQILWASLAAQAAYWGIAHENEFVSAFEAELSHYNEAAPEWVRAGLAISTQSPWASVEDFYTTCEEMVASFQEERPSLAPLPTALGEAGVIGFRLKFP